MLHTRAGQINFCDGNKSQLIMISVPQHYLAFHVQTQTTSALYAVYKVKVFFSDVLTYCVMLLAFIMLLFLRQMFMMRVCVCVSVCVSLLFIGIVQCN